MNVGILLENYLKNEYIESEPRKVVFEWETEDKGGVRVRHFKTNHLTRIPNYVEDYL